MDKARSSARFVNIKGGTASGLIVTICGALGKTTRAAHDLRKIRSRIRVPRVAEEPTLKIVQVKAA